MNFNRKIETIDFIKNLIFENSKNLADKKMTSQLIDKKLGYKSHDIEVQLQNKKNQIKEDRKTWIGFDNEIFQTTYSEFLEIYQVLVESDSRTDRSSPLKIVDVGSAYGRISIIKEIFFNETQLECWEIIKERHDEAVRVFNFLFPNVIQESVRFVNQNILSEEILFPNAHVYFIYDFSDLADFLIVLKKLSEVARKQKMSVVSRGRGSKNWIYQYAPWLCEIVEPKKFDTWILFQSAE